MLPPMFVHVTLHISKWVYINKITQIYKDRAGSIGSVWSGYKVGGSMVGEDYSTYKCL
jgi:hypothetical protein